MSRKKWILLGGIVLALVLFVSTHYIPLSTKVYGTCTGGNIFKFSIINPGKYGAQYNKSVARYDGGFSSFRHFDEYENSLQRTISQEICISSAHDTAKLYLW